jgi:hypothetical protein
MESSLILGIILGGLINGIENEGLTLIAGLPVYPSFNYIVPNRPHNLVFTGNGSNNKS